MIYASYLLPVCCSSITLDGYLFNLIFTLNGELDREGVIHPLQIQHTRAQSVQSNPHVPSPNGVRPRLPDPPLCLAAGMLFFWSRWPRLGPFWKKKSVGKVIIFRAFVFRSVVLWTTNEKFIVRVRARAGSDRHTGSDPFCRPPGNGGSYSTWAAESALI